MPARQPLAARVVEEAGRCGERQEKEEGPIGIVGHMAHGIGFWPSLGTAQHVGRRARASLAHTTGRAWAAVSAHVLARHGLAYLTRNV